MSHVFNKITRWITLISLGSGIFCLLLVPVLAIRWSQKPFPGIMIEQTRLVSSIGGQSWGPARLGITGQERVIKINSTPLRNIHDYDIEITKLLPGGLIDLVTQNKSGQQTVHRGIRIMDFPVLDFLRLFWLPYFIGMAYLIMGILVYRSTRRSLSGRAFAFFCANACMVSVLTFDLATTRVLTAIWTFAIAQIGGSVIGMGWLIPEEFPRLRGQAWLRVVAYLISLILALWGFTSIYDTSSPWAYIQPWRWSYIYAAFGLSVFLILMIFRFGQPTSQMVHQQVRIILWGGVVAFTPVAIWFAGQLFFSIPWNPLIFLIPLLFFPASIMVAVLRYRLLDVDLIVRRTVIYSTLTITLIIIYISIILLFGELTSQLMGKSNLLTVISTLVVVAIFNPLRRSIQKIVDRRFFRERYDVEKKVLEFQLSLKHKVDLDDISRDLIQVVQDTIQPEFMSFWIKKTKNGLKRNR